MKLNLIHMTAIHKRSLIQILKNTSISIVILQALKSISSKTTPMAQYVNWIINLEEYKSITIVMSKPPTKTQQTNSFLKIESVKATISKNLKYL